GLRRPLLRRLPLDVGRWRLRELRAARSGPLDHLEEPQRLFVRRVVVQDPAEAFRRLLVVAEDMVAESLLQELADPLLHLRSSRCARMDSQSSTVCRRPARTASGISPSDSWNSRAAFRHDSAFATAAAPK